MSFGGSDKIKPEDLFSSLKVIKEENEKIESNSLAAKLVKRLGGEFK
jgi:hypothetical protein